MTRPFRFIAAMPRLGRSPAVWRDEIRRIEDLGFSSVSISEHLTGGWVMEPLAAMLAALDATSRLRVLSLALSNDLRHPVLLHKALATMDVLSGGRLELGLGAGWLHADYEAAGVVMDPPGERIERLGESIRILKGLFGPTPLDFDGTHYQVRNLDGLPKPVQRPHPPILVGGGGRKILTLAAKEADIVGIHARLDAGGISATTIADLSAERAAEKVAWTRDAATAAGRDPDALEWQSTVYLCRIGRLNDPGGSSGSRWARLLDADPGLAAGSPAVLVGSLERCVDLLLERRERYGFSYIKLTAEPGEVAPLVARLAGT